MAGRTKAKHVKNLNFHENFKDFETTEDLPEIEYSQPSVLNGLDHFNFLQGLQLTDRHSFVLEWLMTKCDPDTNTEADGREIGEEHSSPNCCSNSTDSLETSKTSFIENGLKTTENKVSASGSPLLTWASKRKRSPLHDSHKSKRFKAKAAAKTPPRPPVHSSDKRLQLDNQISPVLGQNRRILNLETSKRINGIVEGSKSKNHGNTPSTSAKTLEKKQSCRLQTKENEEVPIKKIKGVWALEDTFKDVSLATFPKSRRSKSGTPARFPPIVSFRETTAKEESKTGQLDGTLKGTSSAKKSTVENNRRYLLQRNPIDVTPRKSAAKDYEDTAIDQASSTRNSRSSVKKSMLLDKSASQIIQDVDSEVNSQSDEQFHISQDPTEPDKQSSVKEEPLSLSGGQQNIGAESLMDVKNKVKVKDEIDKKPLSPPICAVLDIVPAKEKEEDRKKYKKSKKSTLAAKLHSSIIQETSNVKLWRHRVTQRREVPREHFVVEASKVTNALSGQLIQGKIIDDPYSSLKSFLNLSPVDVIVGRSVMLLSLREIVGEIDKKCHKRLCVYLPCDLIDRDNLLLRVSFFRFLSGDVIAPEDVKYTKKEVAIQRFHCQCHDEGRLIKDCSQRFSNDKPNVINEMFEI